MLYVMRSDVLIFLLANVQFVLTNTPVWLLISDLVVEAFTVKNRNVQQTSFTLKVKRTKRSEA